jgi:hypothetical protein
LRRNRRRCGDRAGDGIRQCAYIDSHTSRSCKACA